ncbi:MAG: hypothetical protein JWN14_2953 [Chthonomonadales bacterium]|nr:hypothetical protein [Chthonomonadales bacterium]
MKSLSHGLRHLLLDMSLPGRKDRMMGHIDKPLFTLLTAILIVGNAAVRTLATPVDPPPTALRVAFVTPDAHPTAAKEDAVIFSDSFADPADRTARYFEYNPGKGSFVWKADEGMGAHRGAMRAQFERGQVTVGSLSVVFGKNPFRKGVRSQETFREIYWRVYVKHEAGWSGNPAKLARATCLATSDWSQGFIAHVWGGKGDVLCIDPATGIQDSRKVSTKYNDFDHLHWLGLRQTQTPIFSPVESGRWVCIESHIRLNAPDRKDGIFELWVDGRLEASRADLDWHGAWNDYAINAVFLENYWNDGAVKREARWFSDFVISTKPIGPIVATSPPTFTPTEQGTERWEAQVAADPEGKDTVWTSKPLAGKLTALTLDADHGTFAGSRAGQRTLGQGQTYWLRLRQAVGQPTASGTWSDWTAWHAPFRMGQ